jgi:ubiquinone/menaquinone biosynthesis C-methylase UbiE
MASAKTRRSYVPAMGPGRAWLLPIYDPLTRVLGMGRVRGALLEQAALSSHSKVLDVGCGTGSLAVLIKQRHPTVDVVALDPDARALAKGQRKARRAGLLVQFDRGFADALTYPDAAFDRVFSSVMFHHLERDEKSRVLREIRRVLKRGGRFHMVDFVASAANGTPSRLSSHHRLTENAEHHVLALLTQAGFADATIIGRGALLAGHLRIAYFQGTV